MCTHVPLCTQLRHSTLPRAHIFSCTCAHSLFSSSASTLPSSPHLPLRPSLTRSLACTHARMRTYYKGKHLSTSARCDVSGSNCQSDTSCAPHATSATRAPNSDLPAALAARLIEPTAASLSEVAVATPSEAGMGEVESLFTAEGASSPWLSGEGKVPRVTISRSREDERLLVDIFLSPAGWERLPEELKGGRVVRCDESPIACSA